jgi:AAA15 family ATPase/GTPase
MDFIISAIHVLPECNQILKKGLQDEWYILNDCVSINKDNRLSVKNVNRSSNKIYGKGINICAIIGANGSGKSSLLEILYRIINNISAILERGKHRKAAETLYYIDNLCAELYYLVEGNLCCISCKGDKISLTFPDDKKIEFHASITNSSLSSEVLMKDFIKYASAGLFYTIVTNYSLQAFIAQDYANEKAYILNKRELRSKEDALWLNGLFHKNDGYMTPIVLNPYRDNGVINMITEHHLTNYRLSSCFIHARNTKRQFIDNYKLNRLWYEYNSSFVIQYFVK